MIFYDYEEGKYRVIGRQSRRIYALGDRVTVKVLSASAETRQIDFILAEDDSFGEDEQNLI